MSRFLIKGRSCQKKKKHISIVWQVTYFDFSSFHVKKSKVGGCPRGVMVKALDGGIVVSKFDIQSHYYVGEGINLLSLPAMG